MAKIQKPRNRKQRRSPTSYLCSVCKYASNRRYNIVRHEFRIHSASARPRKCCGVVFKTKGDYYLHCELKHPLSRLTNVTSRTKYKILPNIVSSQLPKKGTFLKSSTQKPREVSYMLRSRGRPKIDGNETKIEFTEIVSSKLWKLKSNSDLKDVPKEDTSDIVQSSTLQLHDNSDTIKSCKTELPYSKDRDEREASAAQEQPSTLNDTSEIAMKESSEPSPTQFSKNEQTAAVDSANKALELSKTFDENANKLSGYSDTLSVSASHLPPKKRILQSLGFSNGENIANARTPLDLRLFLAKPQNLEKMPFSKNHRPSKKKKHRKLRKDINLSRYCSASSDSENVRPLTAPIRKQNTPGLKVDLSANGRFAWDEITKVMRERLQLIDFDSFKVVARCKGQTLA